MGSQSTCSTLPVALLQHTSLFNYVLAHFVPLALLGCVLVLPAQYAVTSSAGDVGHNVQACDQDALLLDARGGIDNIREKVGPAMAPLESL